jgi:hypothetical protein
LLNILLRPGDNALLPLCRFSDNAAGARRALPGRKESQQQGQNHKQNGEVRRCLAEKRGRLLASEHRLSASAAKRTGQTAALARLEKDYDDECETNENVNRQYRFE